ncbi:MAG: DUF2726 domain-containing protein [Methylococcales bacterium]
MLALVRHFLSKATVTPKASEISTVKYRYRQRNKFCSESETTFLSVLEQAAGGSIRVFTKVHAAYVLIPRMELSIENWNSSFDKIAAKQLDYVLCSASDMSILCIVILSSQKNVKTSFDKFLQKACRSAEIPVISLAAEKEYSAAECRYLLKKYIPDAFAQYKQSKLPATIDVNKIKENSGEESLQVMLLREGRRRAMKLQLMQADKPGTS